MPIAITKHPQSRTAIAQMAAHCFPGLSVLSCRELTEGFFNVAYEVELSDGKTVILKIAPPRDVPVMTYEQGIMSTEVAMMRLAGDEPGILVPGVLGYDDSCSICDAPYFFMEKLPGSSLNVVKSALPGEEITRIYEQVGRMNRRINEIMGPCFGYPAQPGLQGQQWYPVFCRMLEAAVADAGRAQVDLHIRTESLWEYLERDRKVFEKVTEPALVHWDCWDGNIFVEEGKITGLIDWERSLWADPLMEVGFRTYDENPAFRRGYGLERLTAQQQRRALWYDIYLLLIASQESVYRQYETEDMYRWANGLLVQQFEKLKNRQTL